MINHNYICWNHALINYFTQGVPDGSKIYLSVDDDVLAHLGQTYFSTSPTAGDDWCTDFCAAVKREVMPGEKMTLHHLQGRDEKGFPKGIAFLGTMVLAAYRMAEGEEINQLNYFSRFRELLGLPRSEYGRPAGMKEGDKEEEPLWQAWAHWLRQQGFLPSAQRGSGPRTYIEYPISQSILRQADKERLRKLFQEKQWQQSWDAETLLMKVRQESPRWSGHLRDLFTGPQLKSRYEAIAEAILQVYEYWQDERDSVGTTTHRTPDSPYQIKGTRHLFAGLYRTQEPVWHGGKVEYAIYPKQLKGSQLAQLQIEYEGKDYYLTQDRPGWYEPTEWSIGESELNEGTKYRVLASETLEDVILPPRDFWILITDPNNPESADYATWGAPRLGEKFILLCKPALLPQLELLKEEHLLDWHRQLSPFGKNGQWLELRECMVIAPAWEGVFIDHQALKEALQPHTGVAINFSGGLRVPHQKAWLVGHAPQLTLFAFSSQAELKITRLPKNDIIFKGVQSTNTPVTIDFPPTPGEYLVEATCGSETTERFIQLIEWDRLSIADVSQPETLSVGEGRICGSVILTQ